METVLDTMIELIEIQKRRKLTDAEKMQAVRDLRDAAHSLERNINRTVSKYIEEHLTYDPGV